MTFSWDAVRCGLVEVDRRFKGAYCLHHQGCNFKYENFWNSVQIKRVAGGVLKLFVTPPPSPMESVARGQAQLVPPWAGTDRTSPGSYRAWVVLSLVASTISCYFIYTAQTLAASYPWDSGVFTEPRGSISKLCNFLPEFDEINAQWGKECPVVSKVHLNLILVHVDTV
jgi:hypothetical protein